MRSDHPKFSGSAAVVRHKEIAKDPIKQKNVTRFRKDLEDLALKHAEKKSNKVPSNKIRFSLNVEGSIDKIVLEEVFGPIDFLKNKDIKFDFDLDNLSEDEKRRIYPIFCKLYQYC